MHTQTKTKGNALLWILLLIGIALMITLIYYNRDTLETNGGTITWQTYTNEEFNFSLEYPSNWEIAEYPDHNVTPRFNLYPESNNTSGLPYTHHSGNIAHVSIFPQGVPTEGFFGESSTSSVDFQIETVGARDYILSSGARFATIANASSSPTSWNESGYVFSHVFIEELETECLSEGEVVSQAECDPLFGDVIVRTGSVSQEDRATQVRILESLEFF
ncbi:MAG: hypothetical protein WDZ64_00960 [Parcubacteria group bacterium]